MPNKLFFLFLFLIPFSEISAQVKSNKYFDVIDSTVYKERRAVPLDNGAFLNVPYGLKTGKIYHTDKEGIRSELPCDKIRWLIPIEDKTVKTYHSCYNEGKGALFSMETLQPVSPAYDSIRFINQHFYITWEKDSMYVYTTDNQMIFKSKAVIHNYKSSAKIRRCYDDILHFKLKEEDIYLNKKGEILKDVICEKQIDDAKFPDGSYKFKKGRKWGLKNKKGKIIIEPIYKFINFWQDGKYIVVTRESIYEKYSYGIVNKKGKFLIPLKEESIKSHHSGLTIKKGKKFIFLDQKLKDKYHQEFDRLKAYKCGLVICRIGEKEFYDLLFTKKNEITNGTIDGANVLSDDLCYVRYKNGLFVIYDKSGKIIFESYKNARAATSVLDNVIRVYFNSKKQGLINAKGEWIIKPGSYYFERVKNKDGIFMFNHTTKRSDLINPKGELIYPSVRKSKKPPLILPQNFIVSNDDGEGVVSPLGELIIPFGDYRIREFTTTTPTPKYYQLVSGNMNYLVQIK